MMNKPDSRTFEKIYSFLFASITLAILFAFLPTPRFSLSDIPSDFRWRKNLINLYTSFRYRTGDRVFNNAVVGKDGWIFYTGEMSIPDYQNSEPLQKKTLISLRRGLNKLNSDLKNQGIQLLVVIPPNKSTIYSQYMPHEIPVLGAESRLDQFVKFMNDKGDVAILDLRQTLLHASLSQGIYFKTDSHWNDLGAYYGYVEIMNRLHSAYQELTPHSLSDYEYRKAGVSSRDLTLLMGLQNLKEETWILTPKFPVDIRETAEPLPDGEHYIRTIVNGETDLPELLVYRDSFYSSLGPFLAPHFSRVTTLPYTPDLSAWSLERIQQEKPDVVIIEVTERYIGVTLPLLLGE
jgi:hypothetical protein